MTIWSLPKAQQWAAMHRAAERLGVRISFLHTEASGWRPYVSVEKLLTLMDEGRKLTAKIPDWRPGAVYWRPLEDGREITVYPLLFGTARLCVGPLADPIGYDNSYIYESVEDALGAAEDWNSELASEPSGWLKRREGIVGDPDPEGSPNLDLLEQWRDDPT